MTGAEFSIVFNLLSIALICCSRLFQSLHVRLIPMLKSEINYLSLFLLSLAPHRAGIPLTCGCFWPSKSSWEETNIFSEKQVGDVEIIYFADTPGCLDIKGPAQQNFTVKLPPGSNGIFTLKECDKCVPPGLSRLWPRLVEEVVEFVNDATVLEKSHQFKPAGTKQSQKVSHALSPGHFRNTGNKSLNTYSVTLGSKLPTHIRLSLLGCE